jgi:hypothetical protein
MGLFVFAQSRLRVFPKISLAMAISAKLGRFITAFRDGFVSARKRMKAENNPW